MPLLLGQCRKRWIAQGAGNGYCLLYSAMRWHNRAPYTTIQQHMTVQQLAESGSPMSRSLVLPSIALPVGHVIRPSQPHGLHPALAITCMQSLWQTSHLHSITAGSAAMCFQRACIYAGCWSTRPPAMWHPHTICSWRGTGWCWLPMAVGTSHHGCTLHAWAMLRVLTSKAGCVYGMLWAGCALGMVVLGFAPLIASAGHAPSPGNSSLTSGLHCGCYTTTHRPAQMLVLRQRGGSIDVQTW